MAVSGMNKIHDTEAGWHREDIKAAIRKRKVTLAELSRRIGDEHGEAVRVALQRPWPAVEQRIAEFLSVPADKLWPDRYTDGLPIRQRIRASKYDQTRGRRGQA